MDNAEMPSIMDFPYFVREIVLVRAVRFPTRNPDFAHLKLAQNCFSTFLYLRIFDYCMQRAVNRYLAHTLAVRKYSVRVARQMEPCAPRPGEFSDFFLLPLVAWDYIARMQPAHGMRETVRDMWLPRGKPLTATDSPILWAGYVRAKIIPRYRWSGQCTDIASTCEDLAINIPFSPVASSTTFYSSKRLECSF